VRPEHVRLGPLGSTAPEQGSRLSGTIGELVYLGMYTQFHVDTPAGRIVSHRLADEPAVRLEAGAPVTLSWPPEHATVVDSTL
jgi:ABC-type Fe3+/spermidine/putrescine transport system ATPase subunit